MKRIGVFGGAFNPPHIAHKQIIEIALKELKLDYVIVLPSNNPPHKDILVSKENRKKLIELAFSNNKNTIIDYVEFNSNKINYSADTIKYLKEKYDGEIFYIIGGDSMINFDKWKNPEFIINNVNLTVLIRGNEKEKVIEKINYFENKTKRKIYLLNEIPTDISSSLLRFYLATNLEKYSDLIDSEVYKFIKENSLYGDYQKMIDDLFNTLPEKRFYHCLRVVEFALKLNSVTLRLDDKVVATAALLHDIAKPKEIMQDFLENRYLNNDEIINLLYSNKTISPVLHAFVGPYIAKERYKIEDKNILDAIRYHTTARVNMTDLDKLIFVSDMLEENRNFEGVQELRELIFKDFNEGFRACIRKTYDVVRSKTDDVFYITRDAYKYYK